MYVWVGGQCGQSLCCNQLWHSIPHHTQGTCVQDNTLNIFLEYVPGGSIASLLAKFGTVIIYENCVPAKTYHTPNHHAGSFKEAVIRAYTRQILQGLEYLHKHKIMVGVYFFGKNTAHKSRPHPHTTAS